MERLDLLSKREDSRSKFPDSVPNWFPMLTLMVGNPGETDEDVMDTLDLVYEMERRGLHAFLIPSVFTPLNDTCMMNDRGVSESLRLSPLQWQLILKCWKVC
jgi:tRNA A37 methylthiotransferase MiaB